MLALSEESSLRLTLWLAPETLGEVKSIFPLLAITLVTAILGQLPILILFGLGSSRVGEHAFLLHLFDSWSRRSGVRPFWPSWVQSQAAI